ncbi:MAG TPA: hypothetical protein VIJ70_01145 [Gaiellaceae bacterium]
MAAGKLNAAQQRERRARIMLAVLGLVFVGVLALELPKMLGGGQSNPTAIPATTSTTSSTTTSNVASLSTTSTIATASSSGTSPGNQLVAFSRFAAKDPFRQQVNLAAPGGTSGGAGGAAGGSAQKSPVAKQPITTPPSVRFSVQPVKQPPSGLLVPAALLKVDGKQRIVRLGEAFPAVKPLFRLVSMSQKAIWIKLLGGSFSNGESTLKIVREHPVTLANTTAGTRMALGLVRPTTARSQPKAPSAAAQTAAK